MRRSGGLDKGCVGDGLSERFPAIDLSHDDLPRGHQSPKQHRHGLGAWQHGLGLDAAAEFLVQAFDRICRSGRFPLALWQTREGEKLISCFFQAVSDGLAFQPPFSQKCLAAGGDFLGCFGVDHVAVIFCQLIMHTLGCLGQKVAVLVHRAPLDRQIFTPEGNESDLKSRCPVHDDKFGPFQPARIQIVDELTPE